MTTQQTYHYQVVDVFTREQLEGNPLAVFPEATGLDDRTMQRIARELNLSETVFVYPATRPDCAALLRIFTPVREMIFAGHPTIGTSFVLLVEGLVPEQSVSFVLEEKVGPVLVRVERGDRPLIWLTTPPIEAGRMFGRTLCASVLGLAAGDLLDCEPQLLSAGNPTIFVAVKDKAAVDRASLSMDGMKKLHGESAGAACVFLFTPVEAGAYSRMFAPEFDIIEDPATGSSTGPLAAYMMRHRLAPRTDGTRFASEQGTKMGRRSILHVQIHGDRGVDGIEVGGYVTPIARGEMRLGPEVGRPRTEGSIGSIP